MRADYGYSNARIRGMKSYLFDRTFYEKLIKKDSLTEVISALEKTDYGKDIGEGLLKYPGAPGVEEGLRRNITHDFRKIVGIVNGEARELVGILLGRWDVHNLKTVLRGKHIGAPSEEIVESIIPAGVLGESVFLELVKQPELKACIDLLAVWEVPYARPLTEKFPLYAKYRSLPLLELALDKFYYEFSLRRLRRSFFKPDSLSVALVREILAREIDFVNIMTLLRLPRQQMKKEMERQREGEAEEERGREEEKEGKEELKGRERKKAKKKRRWLWKRKRAEVGEEKLKMEAGEAEEETEREKQRLTLETSFNPYFIGGGKELGVERLAELAEVEEVEDIVHSLRDVSYWGLLNKGLKKYFETGILSPLERSMEEQIIRKSISLFKADPLSVAIIIAYIWAKFNEVVNLRIIVRGKSVEMPEEKIREELVLV